MHHKNEVTKIIHEITAGQGLEIDFEIGRIHQLMDDYAKGKTVELITFQGRKISVQSKDIRSISEPNDLRYPSIRSVIKFYDGKKIDCSLSYNEVQILINK